MSLIQEALKRKQDGPPPSGGNLTDKGLAGGPVKKHHNGREDSLPLAVILIGGVSLVVILILMTLLFWQHAEPQADVVTMQAPAETGPAITTPPRTSLRSPSAPQPPSTAEAVSPPAPAPAPVVQPTPVAVAAPDSVPTPAQPPAPAAKTKPWPTLKVMGVLTNPESDSDSVIVNGQIRDPGEKINGVTILRVDSKGVLFRFNGESQFVKVGRSYPE